MLSDFLLFFGGLSLGLLLALSYFYKQYRGTLLKLESEKMLLEHQLLSQQKEHLLKDEIENQRFENFAQSVVSKGIKTLEENSTKSMEQVLKPLKEKIKDFESKVERAYEVEARERFSLKKEIERISHASENLGKVLRGDFKTQGIWGEIILERILEVSGLREGIEYVTQGKDMDLKSEDGSRYKPDVIIHLPDGKHFVIDSKVSLESFEKWMNEDSPEQKEAALRVFSAAVLHHVEDLSQKHYSSLKGIKSPDFVFLFFPIEAALVSLHEKDPKLFSSAWKKRVVLVGPSTLLPTLKTVESIWKNDRQNQNALEIARIGGQLYDKFSSFCDDLVSIGKSLGSAQGHYDEALKKLKDGKGNLLRQTEKLKELGVRSQKQLPKELVENLVEESVLDQ